MVLSAHSCGRHVSFRCGTALAWFGAAVTWFSRRRTCAWGRPRWAASGHLAIAGFVGIRRAVFGVDLETASTTPIAVDCEASYELLEYLGCDRALCRRRRLDGSVDLVHSGPEGDVLVDAECGPKLAWGGARLLRWKSGGCDLEGILVPSRHGKPPWPMVTFLHGGPVATLAVGEQDAVGAWADQRWATLIPEFPASGICGESGMLAAFEARELPDNDYEVDAVLAGIDAATNDGRADPDRLFLVGHSYGAYLANRALTRTSRFRAAVCWEGVADIRRLDQPSVGEQARWRGGTPLEVPERWSAASPIERAHLVKTPTLLVHGERSTLTAQGERWRDALRREGVSAKLVVLRDAGHTFQTETGVDEFRTTVAAWFASHDLP